MPGLGMVKNNLGLPVQITSHNHDNTREVRNLVSSNHPRILVPVNHNISSGILGVSNIYQIIQMTQVASLVVTSIQS